jgi:imidazoleglycerol-phosphate dehydratase
MPDASPDTSTAVLEPRTAEVRRTTGETDVTVRLALDPGDGGGPAPGTDCDTGVGFFDHMLDALARHGGFALAVRCDGDLKTGDHHTVEDVGIALGQALSQALGEKDYVARYGHACVPMDEALARAAVDLSGRFYLAFEADFSRERTGDLSTEMTRHFWRSVAEHAGLTLHLDLLKGDNAHHQVEALFKAGARALRAATRRDPDGDRTPSTKGVL